VECDGAVLRGARATIVAGLARGLAASATLTGRLKSQLPGVSSVDGRALTAACTAMPALALLAAFLSARQTG
jgi:hypothetical protein